MGMEESDTQRRIAELEAKMADETRAREEAEAAERKARLDASLDAAFDELDVPVRARPYILAVLHAKRTDGREEPVLDVVEGRPVFRRTWWDEPVSVADGVREWLAGEGKFHVEGRDSSGATSRGDGAREQAAPRDEHGRIDWGRIRQRLADGLASGTPPSNAAPAPTPAPTTPGRADWSDIRQRLVDGLAKIDITD